MQRLYIKSVVEGDELFKQLREKISSSDIEVELCNEDISIRSKSGKLDKSIRYIVASNIADYIMNKYEKDYITKRVKQNYKQIFKRELNSVLNYTLGVIKNYSNIERLFRGCYPDLRRTAIINEILEYTDSHDTIIPEGIMRFRLMDYKREVDSVIIESINWYLNKSEICRVMEILGDIQHTSEINYKTVNVILNNNGYHKILDGDNEEIDVNKINKQLEGVRDKIDYGSLLVLELLSLSPKRIILHNIERFWDDGLISALRDVFGIKLDIHKAESETKI